VKDMKQKKKIVYFLFGGSSDNIRASRLIEEWEHRSREGVFVVTGYPTDDEGELESMVSYLLAHGVPPVKIWIASSYETLSNVECVSSMLFQASQIFVSTSWWHWKRFCLIFDKYYQGMVEKILFLCSGEQEASYAKGAFWFYKLVGPKCLQQVAKLVRRKKYELCNDESIIQGIAKKFGVNLMEWPLKLTYND